MSEDTGPNGAYANLADLTGRRDALRQAAGLPDADPRALLDAAFAELDAAAEVLAKLIHASAGEPDGAAGAPGPLSAERNLLRAVFQQAPVALFLLEQDGTIRRANDRAGGLIGAPAGYATGKPLTAFVDVASRAVVQSQLAAAARTGTATQAGCTLLGPDGPVAATLTASVLQDGARLLVVTASGGPGAQSPRVSEEVAPTGAVAAMTRRMDMITAVTRLLLENSTFSEAVTVQRCARLLAGDIASWVLVDLERSGELRRQFVVGPSGEQTEELARKVREADPAPRSTAPAGPWSWRTPTRPGRSAPRRTGRRCCYYSARRRWSASPSRTAPPDTGC
jgi:PAS domain-containing protein